MWISDCHTCTLVPEALRGREGGREGGREREREKERERERLQKEKPETKRRASGLGWNLTSMLVFGSVSTLSLIGFLNSHTGATMNI